MLTLSNRMASAVGAMEFGRLPQDVVAKVKIALLDYLSCAYESLDLPFSRMALERARAAGGTAPVVGAGFSGAAGEAAFANAVLGHGLVREDMHTGSVSHLGVVVFPALLSLGHQTTGRSFVNGVVCGYEVACAVGRALMDAENVRLWRPTGICGPVGAAAGAARMLGMDERAIASAIGLAANTSSGFNEWPREGADDMYFHVGFAARNAVTCAELAGMGAYASATAVEGLFNALRRGDRAAQVAPFGSSQQETTFEILEVYHKPAPACNYAQTACQAALLIAKDGVRAEDVAAIAVHGTAAALNYPGCNASGPFERVLQAKMSIQYCVAATLRNGAIAEANYRMLDDAEIARLIGVTTLQEDAGLTAGYPKKQGAGIRVTLRDGRTVERCLDDVVPATGPEIRARFVEAAGKVLGAHGTARVTQLVDRLEDVGDLRELTAIL